MGRSQRETFSCESVKPYWYKCTIQPSSMCVGGAGVGSGYWRAFKPNMGEYGYPLEQHIVPSFSLESVFSRPRIFLVNKASCGDLPHNFKPF